MAGDVISKIFFFLAVSSVRDGTGSMYSKIQTSQCGWDPHTTITLSRRSVVEVLATIFSKI